MKAIIFCFVFVVLAASASAKFSVSFGTFGGPSASSSLSLPNNPANAALAQGFAARIIEAVATFLNALSRSLFGGIIPAPSSMISQATQLGGATNNLQSAMQRVGDFVNQQVQQAATRARLPASRFNPGVFSEMTQTFFRLMGQGQTAQATQGLNNFIKFGTA